ncbi:MFS general substrate transporter [Mucor ambiguus]|uniref:MFS general substrate transporter n=1 Tax=Mucor ambiguus TaxID=91626 RepID=A0A0C9N879_9FUNG|nr:MFS general substrate transporter [Mucor ambiguus]
MTDTSANLKSVLISKLSIKPPVTQDPRAFGTSTKGIILVCIGLCAGTAGFASIPYITADLNAPSIATTLTAALFILMMGIAPVFWAAMSDNWQVRRIMLFVSMIIFAVSSLGCALIDNIWGLVVLRCIQAVGSSCGQSVGAGVISDCYPIEQRGAAFGKFFLGLFLGPLVGPIVGGFLIMSALSWRATFWFCVAFAGVVAIGLFLFFPETFRDEYKWNDDKTVTAQPDELNQTAAKDLSKEETTVDQNKIVIEEDPSKRRQHPLAAFILLKHPFIMIASLVSGIAFGCMFAVETIIPDLYEEYYGFNSWQTGLSYLGAGIGNLLGSILGGALSDRLLLRSRRLRGGQAVCEDRLTANVWPACLFIPFGLLLFGWSIEGGLTFWAPIVAFGIQSFGMNQIMTATSAYIVDATPGSGASATASANLVLATIGAGWTCVFLTGLSVVLFILLIILKIYGQRLRSWSGFTD